MRAPRDRRTAAKFCSLLQQGTFANPINAILVVATMGRAVDILSFGRRRVSVGEQWNCSCGTNTRNQLLRYGATSWLWLNRFNSTEQ
jgi:hypothetical protein